MKNNKLVLSLLSLLLLSCGVDTSAHLESSNQEESSTSENFSNSSLEKDSSSSNQEEQSSETNISSSSEEEITSSEEETIDEQVQKASIKEVKNACLQFIGEPNKVGLEIGNQNYEIEGLIISIFDFGKSTKDYNGTNPYKAIITDGQDYLTIALDKNNYLKVKDYVGKEDTIYRVIGKTSRLNGKAELVVTSFEFLESSTQRVSKDQLFSLANDAKSIVNINERLKKSPLNEAGNYDGQLSILTLKYVTKIENEVLLFTDGQKYITMHGSNQLYNLFKNSTSSYEILFQENMYHYGQSLEYIASRTSELKITPPIANKAITSEYLYTCNYVNGKSTHFEKYEEVKSNIYNFKGYVDYYLKNGLAFFTLVDKLPTNSSHTITASSSLKSLFVNNESESKLDTASMQYSKLYEAYAEDKEIELTVYPYNWNSQKYFQVQILF
ncbi:MAG TPA: hypothetical protein DD377_01010 [Firmicutes bacterium]|nr:hypothetical protein [Bacillota bacterium]